MSVRISTVAELSASQIALALFKAPVHMQVEVMSKLALLLTDEARDAIAAEVNVMAGEEESIALCRLGRAINEREGFAPNADMR